MITIMIMLLLPCSSWYLKDCNCSSPVIIMKVILVSSWWSCWSSSLSWSLWFSSRISWGWSSRLASFPLVRRSALGFHRKPSWYHKAAIPNHRHRHHHHHHHHYCLNRHCHHDGGHNYHQAEDHSPLTVSECLTSVFLKADTEQV